MRTFQRRLKSFFLSRRWAKAYLRAWNIASRAWRFFVERPWRWPLVIAKIFLRRLFDVVPPFTRAINVNYCFLLLFFGIANVTLHDLARHHLYRQLLAAVARHLAGAALFGIKVVLARLARNKLPRAGNFNSFRK